jgi:moderate conductance mechanosensitive channel
VLKKIALAVVGLVLAATLGTSAFAQGSAPPAMPQQQFDELVNAITKSVLEKLKSEPPPASKPVPASRSPFDASNPEDPDEITLFFARATATLKAVPELGHYLGEFRRALDQSANGGMGRRVFLLFLAGVVAVALAAEAVLRQLWGGLRARLAEASVPERGLRSLRQLGMLVLLDGLGVVVVWLVGRASIVLWFRGNTIQDRFAGAFLFAILLWRLYALLLRIVFRPSLAAARLCDMDDVQARRMYRLTAAFVLLVIMLRLLFYVSLAMGATPDAIAAGRFVTAPLVLAVMLWLVVRTREGARQWFGGLGRVAPVVGFIGRNWLVVALSFFMGVFATQLYGAVSGRMGVSSAMILTLNLVAGLLVFETLLQALVRRLDSQLPGYTPAGDRPKLPDVIARCLRVAVLIIIAVSLAESWVVDVLRLVNESAWDRLTRAGRTVGITLFTAFVVWELFRYATEAYMSRISRQNTPAGGAGAAPGPGAVPAAAIATRFDTLMPMVRITVGVLICTVALLIALGDLGVDIGPLLAGASVVGLAISFGSQTLVRDIVSGIFYLADDAFRVGEYIDCGRAKGTVEGFTLRSIRLRHQNGQIHTIPFGSLGQITNFSRDWTAVKFTLPFARNTDLEKLRKAAKQIGVDLMEEPDFKAQLIEPFKMQGVADVTDSALVVRFKFTARPGNPNAIQNQAVTRLLRALPELGIELSQPAG